jgi:hypothetical protein
MLAFHTGDITFAKVIFALSGDVYGHIEDHALWIPYRVTTLQEQEGVVLVAEIVTTLDLCCKTAVA